MFCCNKKSVDTVSLLNSSASSIQSPSPVPCENPVFNNTTVSEPARSSNQAHSPQDETTLPNCVQQDVVLPPKQEPATSSQTPMSGEHPTSNNTTVSEPARTDNVSSNQTQPTPDKTNCVQSDGTTPPKQDSATLSQTPGEHPTSNNTQVSEATTTQNDSTTSGQTACEHPTPNDTTVSDEHSVLNDTTVSEQAKTQGEPSFRDKLRNMQNYDGKSSKKDEPISSNLVFKCKLAHNGQRGSISGFTNLKELYQRIGDCFNVDPVDILFCTANTHRLDMNKLLSGHVYVTDVIFAHIRGQSKEVKVTKPENALGLTFTDNNAGNVFVKKIEDGSFISKVPLIEVGDAIEKINDKSMMNCKHFDVAEVLKEIPAGTTFSMRLVAPKKRSTEKSEGNHSSGSSCCDTSDDETATQRGQRVVTQSQMNEMENEIMQKTTDLIDKLERRVLDLEERNDTLQKEISAYKTDKNEQDESTK